jgi:hypothetical protein
MHRGPWETETETPVSGATLSPRCPQLIRDALEARSVHEQTERFAALALRTTKATSI